MLKKIISIGLLVGCAFSANLKVTDGFVKAHTEIFGDSEIDPVSKVIDSQLTIDDTIESLKGLISVSLIDLKSDNAKRDEHMGETLSIEKYTKVFFDIKNVEKVEKLFLLKGTMDLHGVKKDMSFKTDIKYADNKISLNGTGDLEMTKFDIEPPTLLFLEVRDKIDINFEVDLIKE